MSDGLVRRARPADTGQLVEIDSQASSTPWGAGRLEAALAVVGENRERVLVYELQASARGFLVYSTVLDEASLLYMAVLPRWQGSGIGRSLLLVGLGEMRRDGARVCLLEVRESNGPARHLYRSAGFSIDGRRRNYYRTAAGREDALLMSLAL